MHFCRCNEKVIEVTSAEYMKDVSKYSSMVKGNTYVRVISDSGCKMTISAPAISNCKKCNKVENEL